MIVFLTGACGVGKTTLLNNLKVLLPEDSHEFFHSDQSPVPTESEMLKLYEGWGSWQEGHTEKWMDRLLARPQHKHIFYDGQFNLDFVLDGMARRGVSDYRIVLIHCPIEEMNRRLIEERNQPDLAHQDQANWNNFLHRQAKEKGVLILNSSLLPPLEFARHFIASISGTDAGAA
ncbi:MAG: hypothetical protein AB8H12_19115 [Lewinella sp.]